MAAESQWSKDMIKKQNAILARGTEKLVLDQSNKYPINVIIALTLNAKNSLHSCYSYS